MPGLNDDYTCHVQKFNLDEPMDKSVYENLLNREKDGEVTISRDQVTFDRTKGNCALIIVWWKEFV